MSKKQTNVPKPFQLPKDALQRVALGHAFAEYDPVLKKPGVFVETPAVLAAKDASRGKCFFVGRRGTGKTAITYYLGSRQNNVINIHPQLFGALSHVLTEDELRDVKQQPFHSLVASFKRAILDEVLGEWVKRRLIRFEDFPDRLRSERNLIEDYDFDTRTLTFVEESERAHHRKDDKAWIKLRNRAKEVSSLMDGIREGGGLGLPGTYRPARRYLEWF